MLSIMSIFTAMIMTMAMILMMTILSTGLLKARMESALREPMI